MDIVYHLKRFLTEQQDEAAIPNLGVFYVSDTTETGQALPTGKKIFLFKEKTPRSNAFINYLGYEEKILEAEASAAIDAWVEGILESLRTKRSCVIPELGSFDILQGKVTFRPAANQMLDDNFGLPPTTEDPAPNRDTSTQTQTETPNTSPMKSETTPKDKHNKVLYTWLIVAAVIVLLFGGAFASYKSIPSFRNYCNQTCAKIQSYFKAEPSSPETITLDALEDDLFLEEDSTETVSAPASTSVQTDAPAQSQTVTEPKYHVIAGSFSSERNARKFLKKIKDQGFANASMFFDAKKNYHMISLKAFATQAEAVSYKRHEASNIEGWIYKK